MGYEKKTKEFEDILTKALKEMLFSPETESGFNCPFGRLSFAAVTELRQSLSDARNQIETLKTNVARMENDGAFLNKEKEDVVRRLEDCSLARSKLESASESIKREYESKRGDVEAKLSRFDGVLEQKKALCSDFVVELVQTVEESVKESLKSEPVHGLGAIKLSDDILAKINLLFERYGLDREKRIAEVRLTHAKLVDSVGKNERFDRTIPMRFLNLADTLLKRAEQAISEGKRDVAVGYRNSASELLNCVERLYEDPVTIRLLGAWLSK